MTLNKYMNEVCQILYRKVMEKLKRGLWFMTYEPNFYSLVKKHFISFSVNIFWGMREIPGVIIKNDWSNIREKAEKSVQTPNQSVLI